MNDIILGTLIIRAFITTLNASGATESKAVIAYKYHHATESEALTLASAHYQAVESSDAEYSYQWTPDPTTFERRILRSKV